MNSPSPASIRAWPRAGLSDQRCNWFWLDTPALRLAESRDRERDPRVCCRGVTADLAIAMGTEPGALLGFLFLRLPGPTQLRRQISAVRPAEASKDALGSKEDHPAISGGRGWARPIWCSAVKSR